MKNLISALSLAAALLVAAPVVAGDGAKVVARKPVAEKLTVDPQASKVEWFATKVTGKHNGTVMVQSGTVETAAGRLTGGEFVVDMTSMKDTDIQDAGYNAKLIGHLKSEDFFGVEKFPTSMFKITSVAPIKGAAAGQPNYTVTGDMTIKGITNRVSFPATVAMTDAKLTAAGSFTIDRSKYDVKYGSNSFFDNLGDKAISNDVKFDFNIVAKK